MLQFHLQPAHVIHVSLEIYRQRLRGNDLTPGVAAWEPGLTKDHCTGQLIFAIKHVTWKKSRVF